MPAQKISDSLTPVNLHLTAEQIAALDKIRKRRVMSRSALARELIDKAIKENKKEEGK